SEVANPSIFRQDAPDLLPPPLDDTHLPARSALPRERFSSLTHMRHWPFCRKASTFHPKLRNGGGGCNVYGKPSLGGDSGTGLEARQGLSDCSVTK
ncbi:MAG: hypothetical protein ACLPTZ_08555, partial [Beijerinckiaceae bacterium]